jgi:F-type H+-transporting ATPase subunit gamma
MRDIKHRIRSVTSIEKITNAMRLVSAAKLRRARIIFDRTNEALDFITESIDKLCSRAEEIPSRYMAGTREIKRTCYIVVTSNRGLAGSYNFNIFKAAEQKMKDDQEKPLLVCFGGKGAKYFRRLGYEILSEHMEPLEDISFKEIKDMTEPVIELFDKGEIDEVIVVYTEFFSTIEQHAVARMLLPFEWNKGNEESKLKKLPEYEPDPIQVFDYLVPKYAQIMTYQALLEAATCEHAARRMAMQNATDNAHDMTEQLELFYNQARQAAITSEITEIVSGADAIR